MGMFQKGDYGQNKRAAKPDNEEEEEQDEEGRRRRRRKRRSMFQRSIPIYYTELNNKK
jgi:hypothetical protein